MANLRQAPYYDDYDSSKNYTEILAVPGRVAQAREITQAQTLLKDHLGRLGDAVFVNGTVISGCSLHINNNTATVGAGKIYLDGLIRNVDETTLEISGNGIEYIGAKVNTTIVTEEQDSSLNDPVTDMDNYGKPGAHRLKEVVSLMVIQSGEGDSSAVSNQNAAKVYTLNNGKILKAEDTQTISTVAENNYNIYDLLARRTYDEMGNYKVKGLLLSNLYSSDSNGINIGISSGKAYVNGYEVTKITDTNLSIDYCDSVLMCLNEPKVYQTGTLEYKLNRSPVKELISVMSIVEKTETRTRGGTAGGFDTVTSTPVVSIVSITDKDGVTYTNGTDFQLTNDTIDWSLNGTGAKEPAIGKDYDVTYTYNRNQVIGTDVELVNRYNDTNNTYESFIKFKNEANYPVPNTTTLVDYYYYLARADLVTLDKNGDFVVIKGTPKVLSSVTPPENGDITKMELGSVVVMPGYTDASADEHLKVILVSNNSYDRLSQVNLHMLKDRLDNLEYNTAMSDLDKEAADGEAATALRGILTDGFIGFTKSNTSNANFECCIDADNEIMTLPLDSADYSITPSSANSSVVKLGEFYVAPYTQAVALSQSQATQSFKINPYDAYDPMSMLKLSPAVDNWVDTTTITVQDTKVETYSLRRWWYHGNESWVASEKQKWLDITGTTGQQLGWANYEGIKSQTSTTNIVYAGLIPYMRQTVVTVSGSNYKPNNDNLVCYFNGIKVNLTPTGTTEAGTEAGTIKSDALGKFTATFTVPQNVPCGSVNVIVKNAVDDIGGTAVYTAKGTMQKKEVTTQIIKIQVKTNDPLAQSFQFAEDTILTKLGLFFSIKDTTKDIIVQVRNMVNGYPGTSVYDEVLVEASSIRTSTNGLSETVIEFTRPVYCQADTQYCFVVMSDSPNYEVWTAKIGEKDIYTNSNVVSQPYSSGVMFSSSNNQTWTAHQDMDVKFKLYKAVFSGSGTLNFNQLSVQSASNLMIAADSVDYKNDGIEWYYQINSNEDWVSIDPYVENELNRAFTKVNIKAVLNAKAGSSTSPILNNDSIDVVTSINKLQGSYISRTVFLDNPYNTIAISLEASKPTGTDFTVKYSTDSVNWTELTAEKTTPVDLNEGYYRYEYKKELGDSYTQYAVRIDMTTNSNLVTPKFRKLINVMRNE